MSILLALTAAIGWGASDFLGGLKTKTVPMATVLFVSQGVGFLAIVIVLALLSRPIPADDSLLLSIPAGAAIVVGLGFLYLALARGPVIVVAPVAAVGATIPVAVGLLGGDAFSVTIAAGFAFALLGSVAATYERHPDDSSQPVVAGAMLALGAAIGIGVSLALFHAASEADAYWATGGVRASGWLAALGFLVISRPRTGRSLTSLSQGTFSSLIAIGACSVAGDTAFAAASREGELSVVSVIASLYPVVTVLLAYTILRERVRGLQILGVVLAFAGIALLAGATD